MGMLYYQCKKCGDSIGIQAQFIGNVKCEKCNFLILGKTKDVPRFGSWLYYCKKCDLKFSFEGCNTSNVSCVGCNLVIDGGIVN